MRDIAAFCVSSDATIGDVIERIDANQNGIALMVDADRQLVATITDGDIRRAFMKHFALDRCIADILDEIKDKRYLKPVSAPAGVAREELLVLMEDKSVRHIPLLDDNGRVVDIALRREIYKEEATDLQAVVMAGGFGTRLRPLTEDTPKPMLPVGDKPLMEHMIGQIRDAGIQKVHVTTHFLPEKITSHFGDGAAFGIDLNYVPETQPLGTAGALRLVKDRSQPLLIVNGDILTNIDFRAMREFHSEHEAKATIAATAYEVKIPYGVLDAPDGVVGRLVEKPSYTYFVNAGIYIIEADIIDLIPENTRFDMTDLMSLLIKQGGKVVSFPIREYWLDVGRPEDFARAQRDIQQGVFLR
jgi:dTDP-glucose pyrophosphorylase/CBS domain-containing protein